MLGSIRLGLNGAAIDFGVEKGLGNMSTLACKKTKKYSIFVTKPQLRAISKKGPQKAKVLHE